MDKERLAAFSDGIFAIIITVMVLELKYPDGSSWDDLNALVPDFLSYTLSFIYVGIYWNNHHHLLQTVERVDGTLLWANLHLLFWLSLVPFATSWVGRYPLDYVPAAVYGIVLLLAAVAYFLVQRVIIRSQGRQSVLAEALGTDLKGIISPILYLAGIFWAFVHPLLADAIYAIVAALWLIPDRRIEKIFRK